MMRFEVMQQLNPALTLFSPTHTPIPSDLHNHTYKLHSIILQYNYTPTLCSHCSKCKTTHRGFI